MKVGIIQSNYIPWRGYFDFIRECDAFVLHDDLQYTKSDWRNRNKIKTPQGLRWLTVPVHYEHTAQLIQSTEIDWTTEWDMVHYNQLAENYRGAPHYIDALTLFVNAVVADTAGHRTISALNRALILAICEYLVITTPLLDSRTFHLSPALRKTDRIIAICKALGADTYLSGPAARAYLDEDALRREGIALEYKVYDYPEYPQLHGKFEGGVSVLDLIANAGPAAPDYIWGKP
jgi:hypothetical protein